MTPEYGFCPLRSGDPDCGWDDQLGCDRRSCSTYEDDPDRAWDERWDFV